MASSAAAQTAPKAAPAAAPASETRSAKTTANGDTGLFFVPTAEVLPAKKFSFSLYRTNFDDGQGFSDMSNFPVTLGVGIGGHVEAYGAYNVITRIDRRARPMFFTSTSAETSTGTGGGILPNYPLDRSQWISTNGDLSLGVKINITSEADKKPVAFAIRGGVKIPTGNKTDGASSGEMDYSVDGVLSKEAGKVAELSAYAGYLVRGNPSGYSLTNSVRWGAGIGFIRDRGGPAHEREFRLAFHHAHELDDRRAAYHLRRRESGRELRVKLGCQIPAVVLEPDRPLDQAAPRERCLRLRDEIGTRVVVVDPARPRRHLEASAFELPEHHEGLARAGEHQALVVPQVHRVMPGEIVDVGRGMDDKRIDAALGHRLADAAPASFEFLGTEHDVFGNGHGGCSFA